jgi:pullulanase/glycogen debranching enzyme
MAAKAHIRGFISLTALALAACGGNDPAETAPQTDPQIPANEFETEAQQAEPAYLRSEIRGPRAVWAHLLGSDDRPLDAAAWRLTDASGREIEIAAILPTGAAETLIAPAEDLDITRVHYLELPSQGLRARVRFDGWFRHAYSDKPLGAQIAGDGAHTDFRVFAPRAERVRLYLYDGAEDAPESAREAIWMERDSNGVWEARLEGDLHGTFYDFTVHGPEDPGNQFYGTHPVHVSDPYARVNVDGLGKSRVWRATTPASPVDGGRPAMQDVIAYEVHVQDFTDLLPVRDTLGASLPAFAQAGLTNSRGEPIGFDHIIDLGVNVVHLLPVQEYIHRPPDEWRPAHSDNDFLAEMGVADEDYQWGYRTTHPFAIETRYRATGSDHGDQRDQFRDLVQAFHDEGVAVIIDLVPNHTGENMENRDRPMNLNAFDRHYFYRTGIDGAHIGAFGNEVKTEDRPMTQRWLIDQSLHLVDEFGIDGFRIDLAGQIDEQTLYALREALPDDIIIYGEPWIDTNDPYVRANPDWDWYKEDAPITFFQDETRNAFIGSPFVLENPATDLGYSGGNTGMRQAAMNGIANAWPDETRSPNQGINYIDIHDNWTLADRFATTDWDGREGVNESGYRIAAGVLFTSLGPVVMHGGSEFIRSKGAAPLHEEVIPTATGGEFHFKGREDTFNVRTPNHFVWEDIGRTGEDAPSDYAAMHAWWRGLIHFRRSAAGAVFRVAEAAPDHVAFITPENAALLGYVTGGSVFVAMNVGAEDGVFEDVVLPEGSWRLIASDGVIDHENGVDGAQAEIAGRRATDVDAAAGEFRIWIRG